MGFVAVGLRDHSPSPNRLVRLHAPFNVTGRIARRMIESTREIVLRPGLPQIPERLLLAHARGEVLFVCGAGVSLAACLPGFRQLVLDVYCRLDPAVHAVIKPLDQRQPHETDWRSKCATLTARQSAEVATFAEGDYDVVLGMVERRIDGPHPRGPSRLRTTVTARLGTRAARPAPIHHAIGKLAAVGGTFRVVTTNFDLLFEGVRRPRPPTHSLSSIPRPTMRPDFTGVFHIHGALPDDGMAATDLVLTDQDFGDAYLRRRVVSDFIYDAARLYHLVLIGYSANDPPMRYLLNAIAGDSAHFTDLKERFSFVGASDDVELEQWRARGIVPIPYDPEEDHIELLEVLEEWARLVAIDGSTTSFVDRNIRRILKSARRDAADADRDLFDHLVRRSNSEEQIRIAGLAKRSRADLGWLDAMRSVIGERTTP